MESSSWIKVELKDLADLLAGGRECLIGSPDTLGDSRTIDIDGASQSLPVNFVVPVGYVIRLANALAYQ